MQQEIIQLEIMCKQMYEGQNETRNEAEKVLVAFQNSLDALPKCQLLLDRGDSSYSQLLAATTLTKLISKNAHSLSLEEIIDIRFGFVISHRVWLKLFICFYFAILQKLHSQLFSHTSKFTKFCYTSASYSFSKNYQIWMVLFA